jgi:hypothetical protein
MPRMVQMSNFTGSDAVTCLNPQVRAEMLRSLHKDLGWRLRVNAEFFSAYCRILENSFIWV